ncbi:hypothetical protein KC614_04310 [candidate division WWE3 bacterium]|uniref:Small-conductance mechanosensitive ion channel n=1 Tax=candidate division WWE3 bacterium TaxID=2053526 RepID=A0A955LM34_UNCKA|nr:hypothetical protein [candidate division WWE3 bacterium]
MQEFISEWADVVVNGVLNSFTAFLSYLPNIIAALVIFAVGWIVAGTVKRLVIKLLEVTQIEPFAEKVGIGSALKRVGASVTPNELLGEVVRWAVVLVFLNPTVEILGLSQVTVLINSTLLYIPRVIVAALILMLGIIFADLTSQFVKGTAAALGTNAANALEVITKYSIITFVVLAALSELGIAETLITTLFTGLVAMVAIAGGLAFGLGGKDLAAELLEALKRSLQERTNV